MSVPITTLQRMEFIDSITFSENSQQTLPTNGGLLPNDRFMHSLLLEFRGRLTMPATNGPSAALSDSIAAIIERVTVEGYHKVRRQQEKFIDCRGADLEFYQRFYLPSRPLYTPTSISVAANATNDILLHVWIPFTPLRVPAVQQAGFLLDAPNYESLKLTIQWADWKNLVVAGTNAPTWSAYGSTSGNPVLRVYGGFSLNPARFSGFVPGRVFRWFQEITGSPMTTSATQTRLLDVPRGYDLRSIVLKVGVKATGTSAGNNAFNTLSNAILTDIRFNIGLGKYVRRYLNFDALYADMAFSYNLASQVTGIGVIDFAQNGDLRESLNTRPLIGGPTGNTDVYISADVAGASNQALLAMFEEIRYRPVMAGA